MGSHAAPRLLSFDYRGCREYSVTCCTCERHPSFTEAAVVDRVRKELLQHASVHDFDVSAYCFMPDHVHLLLEANSEDAVLGRLMHGWKQRTGYAHSKETGRRLWQQGYYDHVLREDEDRRRLIAYMIANPVRAGIGADPLDYPFWGSGTWEREQLLEAVQGSSPGTCP